MKWPYGDTVGWDIGKIKQLITRAGPNKGRYEIRFEDGIEYFWPKEPTSQYGLERIEGIWPLVTRPVACTDALAW